MRNLIKNGKLILKKKILDDSWLVMDGEKIVAFGEGTIEEQGFDDVYDAEGKYISPGFIDLHVHGGYGSDFRDADREAYLKILRAHLLGGTTTIMPTLSTSSFETMYQCFEVYDALKAQKQEIEGIPNLAGIHLEGPYCSAEQLGAQDAKLVCLPVKEEYMQLLSATPNIKRWSIACELPGAYELAEELCSRSIAVSIGHSNATRAQAEEAFRHGFRCVTHLYSSCSTIHRNGPYRECGIVEEAYLNDEMDIEIIADGVHLPPDLLKLIMKLKDHSHIALITDSIRPGAGMDVPEGIVMYDDIAGKRPVIIESGVAVMADRTSFAGSIATSARCVNVMVKKAGVPLWDAVAMASCNPARMAGIENLCGSIEKGKQADLLIFDDDIMISHIFVRGCCVK